MEKGFIEKWLEGRSGRLEFFLNRVFIFLVGVLAILIAFGLWIWLVAILFNVDSGASSLSLADAAIPLMLSVVYIVFFIVLVVYFTLIGVRIDVRRLHDIGLSGWYLLIPFFLSIIQSLASFFTLLPPSIFTTLLFLFYLVLFIYPGPKRQNKYGNPQPARNFLSGAFKKEMSLPKEEQTIINSGGRA